MDLEDGFGQVEPNRAAATKVFHATLQRCRVHWMRNALTHAGPKQRPAVVALLKTIFAQESPEAAREQWNQVADALREKYPKLATMMDAGRDDVLAYMDFPREHWAQIASTNPIERLNGEIKRRAAWRPVPAVSQNEPASCARALPCSAAGPLRSSIGARTLKGPACAGSLRPHPRDSRQGPVRSRG